MKRDEPDDTEEMLDRWVQAKRAKDFTTSDKIRDELRAKGIDPDTARPATAPPPRMSAPPPNAYDWGGYSQYPYGAPMPAAPMPAAPPPPPAHSPEVNAKLDEWVQAKRAKDFTTSDRLREELRAQGVDPDTARPNDRGPMAHQGFGGHASAPWYQTPPMMPSMVPPPPPAMHAPPVYDTEINKLLDEWVQAKRAKDFTTSDKIRDTLRARNVDPDTERPSEREVGYPTSQHAGQWGGTPPPPHRGLAPPTCRCTVAQWMDTACVGLLRRHNGHQGRSHRPRTMRR